MDLDQRLVDGIDLTLLGGLGPQHLILQRALRWEDVGMLRWVAASSC